MRNENVIHHEIFLYTTQNIVNRHVEFSNQNKKQLTPEFEFMKEDNGDIHYKNYLQKLF